MNRVLQAPATFSLNEELARVVELPQAEPVRQRLELLNAIYRFAPEVRLHPDDIYRPTSVPWYLQTVRMRRHRRWWFDVQILNPFEVNVQSLISQSSGGQQSGEGTERTNFFLEIVIDWPATRRGALGIAPCYVHFRPDPDGDGQWDLQYWFFYAYNGDITTGADFEHEGDFEHVTVRTSPDYRSIARVFYHVHNEESEWREGNEFMRTEDGRPIVYSAMHTHATYWSAGTQSRTGLPDDHTADGGPAWKTWNSLQLVGQVERPFRGEEWIKYTGQWGQIGTGISWLSGPYGPAFQRYWRNDT